MSDDLRERVAQLVYERGMLYLRTELPAWVPGGNSLAQTEARAVAGMILDAALAEIGGVRDEGLEMKLAYDAYRKGQRDALDGIRVADPRVILSLIRAIAEGKE